MSASFVVNIFSIFEMITNLPEASFNNINQFFYIFTKGTNDDPATKRLCKNLTFTI